MQTLVLNGRPLFIATTNATAVNTKKMSFYHCVTAAITTTNATAVNTKTM